MPKISRVENFFSAKKSLPIVASYWVARYWVARRGAVALSAVILFVPLTQPVIAASSFGLGAEAREKLRYQLQSQFHELDLLVKNRASDELDVKKVARDQEAMQLYARIPRERNLDSLEKELRAGAEKLGVTWISMRTGAIKSSARRLPKQVLIDDPALRIDPADTVETIPLTLEVAGERAQVIAWLQTWADAQTRLVEPATGFGAALNEAPREVGGAKAKPPRYRVLARTYRFLPIEMPKVELPDPKASLPAEARRAPERFAKEEPALWTWVERSEKVLPAARELARDRGQWLLDRARISFFMDRARAIAAATGTGATH